MDFLFRKEDITKQPATAVRYLYAKCKERQPPIENPPRIILLNGIPSATSLSINSDIFWHMELTDSTCSGAWLDIAIRSNHTFCFCNKRQFQKVIKDMLLKDIGYKVKEDKSLTLEFWLINHRDTCLK